MIEKDIYTQINEGNMTTEEYFKRLKSNKHEMTEIGLQDFYNNCLIMKDKFERLGQIDALKKLIFLIETTKKEKACLDLGINIFVYKDAIDEYITNVRNNDVAFIELCRYERIIPDDILEKAEKAKDIFDNMYVLFTDYSQGHKKKHKKETDPILFGTFEEDVFVHDRFYYIGDWVDEYCDLTLEKFITEYQKHSGKDKDDFVYKITNNKNKQFAEIQELKERLNQFKFNQNTGKFEIQVPKAEMQTPKTQTPKTKSIIDSKKEPKQETGFLARIKRWFK